ncbi:ATP-dependent DNA helicase RecQ, partial [hydrothermal vent metagenome]
DSTLREMVISRPANLLAMGQITGVGVKKLERYGDDFVGIITLSE